MRDLRSGRYEQTARDRYIDMKDCDDRYVDMNRMWNIDI